MSSYLPRDVFAGINVGDRRAVYHLIRALKPRQVLEIGTHVGASTTYIAHALGKGARLTTVDVVDVNRPNGPWQQGGLALSPVELLDRLGLSATVEFVTGDSLDYLDRCQGEFNFIFLDGDHASRTVYKEISAALRKLTKNGVILLHDYYPQGRPLFADGNVFYGPYAAVERIRRECPSLEVVSLSPLPWATKLESRNTSLAMLTRATQA